MNTNRRDFLKVVLVTTVFGIVRNFGFCGTVDRTGPLDPGAWEASEWISVCGAPIAGAAERETLRAADGTAVFRSLVANGKSIRRARWMTSGLGVYELYVNGRRVGDDFLKPGYTHVGKTRRSFTYDVTVLLKRGEGEVNAFGVEVGSGWWRDQIVLHAGRKSAFRGVLELVYEDGTVELKGTKAATWEGSLRSPVLRSGIFDGEDYDARIDSRVVASVEVPLELGTCERNDEFKGEILPSAGAEVVLRKDLSLKPVLAYAWKDAADARDSTNETDRVFGHIVRSRTFAAGRPFSAVPGEKIVIDFGQNCAAVPELTFKAAEGTTVIVLPAETLNEGNGERSRWNDGPAGSPYRENLRMYETGMRAKYTFGKGDAFTTYRPAFTFFGYRYLTITTTAPVEFASVVSVPVTSIAKEMELGKIETGDRDVNRLIANVYWGQLSNYLSVPTDCPQRNERLGWTADTQVFAEAGSFNADTSRFFRKWMRDLCDSQGPLGGFPGVAPQGQYGSETMRFGWADAGVIVPYQIWKQFGDRKIIDENWDAMAKYVARVCETKYEYEATKGENGGFQWADWVSFEKLNTSSGSAFETDGGERSAKAAACAYWNYLGACYWMWDAQMMSKMAKATGRNAADYEKMALDAKAYIKKSFFDADDGLILPLFRGMQTPTLFALKLGLVEGKAREMTIAALRANFKAHGDCLQTGFLGTSILMDTLTENGMSDVAYTLLLQHKNPSWLYSVDQGATTIWEHWDGYTKKDGFVHPGMNSFNHYAYGAVLAWIYKSVAGISATDASPGFRRIIMAPKPDRRLGFVKAEYRSVAGLVKSAWRYEGDKWIWEFAVPEGAVAEVTLPGEGRAKEYGLGAHKIEKTLPAVEVLVEFAKSDEHPRNSEGDVVRLRDGRLLVVYSHFYKDPSSKFADGGSDDSSAELVLTESADGGRTWSKMRTAVRKDKGALNVMSASFLRLGDGRLALFYLNKVSSADCRPVMVVSSDEGKTWSAPVDCVSERDKGYYILNNARAVRLQSGRIALPLAYHPFDGKRHAEGAFLLCALSDDDGRTWRLSSDRRRGTPPSGAKKLSLQEPGLVELRDGRLMMYARSNERRQWRLFSTDNGEHWTEPEPVTEYATTTFSPVTYARLADGRLVVVFNDGAAHADAAPTGLERRWPLAVGVSSDEGKTWKTKVLEPDDPKGTVHACYTAAREIDGRLVLVYCHRDMLATTRVVSVPLDWLP